MRSMSSMVAGGAVRILSRRMVRPRINGGLPVPPLEDIHLTPWDLFPLTLGYIHKGLLLPKPKPVSERLVDTLASSLSRALGPHHHLAGRLAVEAHGDGTVTVPLRCTGEGAELVHAAAPGVAVADIVGSLYTHEAVSEFFPLNGVLNVDAAMEPSLPVLSAQVTELHDGVFVAMSMNHSVGDGTVFWELFNAWSRINGGKGDENNDEPPVKLQHGRWFVDTSPVPIPLPLSELQRHVVEPPPPVLPQRLKECFFDFSAASVRKLKAKANAEMSTTGTASAAATILDRGLGWAAWQLNRGVASFDEAGMLEFLGRWAGEPTFASLGALSGAGAGLVTGGSPRFDVFGNDFGWGKPLAVRSCAVDGADGKAMVYEGPEGGGAMSLEVCLAPDAMERLVQDHEFMEAVSQSRVDRSALLPIHPWLTTCRRKNIL